MAPGYEGLLCRGVEVTSAIGRPKVERVVLRVMCDVQGEISFLFGPWGAAGRAEAILQMESGELYYSLRRSDGSRLPIDIEDLTSARRLGAFENGTELFHPAIALQLGV